MNKSVYFPSLNGIRFLAALLVIIHHVEQSKFLFDIESNFWKTSAFVGIVGKLGVVLFFVLSGFLITYLLLVEKEEKQKIAIGKFYVRRILRIWPLYYFIIALSFCVFPFLDFFHIPGWSDDTFTGGGFKIILFLLFLPNVARVIYEPVSYAAQTWSIGVEEQFYLMWPWIINKIKNVIAILVAIVVVYMMVKFMLILASSRYAELAPAVRFWNSFNINCMAIGGIAACLLYYKKMKILTVVYNKYLQVIAYVTLVLLVAFGVEIPIVHFETYGVLFSIVVLNLAANPGSVITLEFPVLDYLGKISYGLYMYHYIAIITALHWFGGNIVLLYVFSICGTVLLASLSYEFFEKKILKFKNKFTEITSGKKHLEGTSV